MDRKIKKKSIRKQKKPPINIQFNQVITENKIDNFNNLSTLPSFDNVSKLLLDFKPSEPCLAKPIFDFNELKDISIENYIYEEKYDGQRMLVFLRHNSKPIYYSRNLKVSSFSHPISLQKNCTNCLLDGELVYIGEDGKILPFCDTQERFKQKEKFLIYDIQYFNSESVMTQSLEHRKELINKSIIQSNHVEIAKFFNCESVENIKVVFSNLIKDLQREGLILKSKSDLYLPNVRLWIKIKSLHLNDMKSEYDLFVYRAYKDKNKRYSILECGNYKCDGTFESICKVSSGLTDVDRGKIFLLVDANGYFINKNIKATIIAERTTIHNSLRLPQFKCFRFDL